MSTERSQDFEVRLCTRRRELEAKVAEGEKARKELSKIDEWLKLGAELMLEEGVPDA